MRMPGFWHRDGARLPALLLAPLAWISGFLTARRMRRPGWRAPVPVISIGNFTAGGAGKTPMAIALATALLARGERPFILTRGHGGAEKGPLRLDPARHDARQVGDEPLLLARAAPVIVARDRAAGARLALNAGASMLLLDDGLQNPHLAKDVSLVMIDGRFGLGNGAVLPAGPLRAPLGAMLPHTDFVVLVGPDESGAGKAVSGTKPVHAARLVPDAAAAAALAGARVIAYSGIGLPEKFEKSLNEIGAHIVVARRFGDHHRFTEAEAEALLALAAEHGARLVTTAKDHVRLTGGAALERLAAASSILPVTMQAEPALFEAIYRAVESARSRISTASGPA